MFHALSIAKIKNFMILLIYAFFSTVVQSNHMVTIDCEKTFVDL